VRAGKRFSLQHLKWARNGIGLAYRQTRLTRPEGYGLLSLPKCSRSEGIEDDRITQAFKLCSMVTRAGTVCSRDAQDIAGSNLFEHNFFSWRILFPPGAASLAGFAISCSSHRFETGAITYVNGPWVYMKLRIGAIGRANASGMNREKRKAGTGSDGFVAHRTDGTQRRRKVAGASGFDASGGQKVGRALRVAKRTAPQTLQLQRDRGWAR